MKYVYANLFQIKRNIQIQIFEQIDLKIDR